MVESLNGMINRRIQTGFFIFIPRDTLHTLAHTRLETPFEKTIQSGNSIKDRINDKNT